MGHDRLDLHGAGKKFTKTEVERIMQRLLTGNIFREDVNKNDQYGGLSSIIKVGGLLTPSFKKLANQTTMKLEFLWMCTYQFDS